MEMGYTKQVVDPEIF